MTNFEINCVLPQYTGGIVVDQYVEFTEYHLLAAHNAYKSAVDIEEKGIQPDEVKIHMAHVSVCIMCCVATLESKINHFVFSNKVAIDKSQINIDPVVLKKYARLKKGYLSDHISNITSAFIGYDILWYLSHKCFLPENQFKEDLSYLVLIRNSLTHFTPELRSKRVRHLDLQNNRKDKFTLNPSYPDKEYILFPYSFMSVSCAKWAIRTCEEALHSFPSMQ